MGLNTRADDTTLLEATRSGDHGAFEVLVQRWLARAYDTASFVLSDPRVASEAVADGFEHLWQHRHELPPASAFGAPVVQATRTAALLRAATGAAVADQEERTTGLFTREGVTAEERLVAAPRPAGAMADPDIAMVVRRAAVAVDPDDRSLLLAHVRDHVSVGELAAEAGTTADEMDQRLFRVRARYRAALEARVLWRSGHPLCGDLARLVGSGPSSHFDAETTATIIDHAESCTACRTAKRLQAAPAALLAALPDVDPPSDLSALVHERLAADGFSAPDLGALSRWSFGSSTAAAEGAAGQRRRRNLLLSIGGAAAVVLALVLLAVQPWGSGSSHKVGVLGGASDGGSASGSIQPNSADSSSRSTKATPAPKRTTTSTSTTTLVNTATSTAVSVLPPVSLVPPATTSANSPVVTAANANVIGSCGADGSGTLLHIGWQTQNATAVMVQPAPVEKGPFPGTGEASVCVPSLPATLTLTATGPGGQAKQDVVVDAPPPTTTSTTASPPQAPPASG